MYPNSFEPIQEISLLDMTNTVGDEMSILTDKIVALPIEMTNSIIDAMYGKMEIHDDVMDIYNAEGTIIRTFELFNRDGIPTTNDPVYKREIKVIP
jgi:hypothetical protein